MGDAETMIPPRCHMTCIDGARCEAPCWKEETMSKAQREKGKRLEREAALLLQVAYPGARRSAMQAGGAYQPDIEGTPLWVEVSGGARPDIMGKVRQAERDKADLAEMGCPDHRPILVLTKRDREPWLATMWIGDWLERVRP